MKTEEQKDRDRSTVFIAICLASLLLFLVLLSRDAAKQQREFVAECKVLGGEMAKQQSHVICIDPRHIIKEMNGDKHAH